MARKNPSPPRPSGKLKKLGFLIGKWHTQGKLLIGGSAASKIIRGMDTYEWVSGGFFILHRVDVFMGPERAEAIELIGYDEEAKSYFLKSFDNQGASITMTGVLTKPNLFVFGDSKMRSFLTTDQSGNSMKATWELCENGKTWKPWMNLELKK